MGQYYLSVCSSVECFFQFAFFIKDTRIRLNDWLNHLGKVVSSMSVLYLIIRL